METFEYCRHGFNFQIEVHRNRKKETLVEVLLNNVVLYYEQGFDKDNMIVRSIKFCQYSAAEHSIYRAIELKED